MGAVDELVVALAGGAVGTVILGGAWAAVRLYAVPGDVARHDERARVLNEDLELWVSDSHRALRQELSGITNDLAGRGLMYSGAHGGRRAEAKSRALHRWRDRLNGAERDLSDLLAAETWAHAAWRRRRGLSPPRLASDRVEPVIEEWRQPVTRHGGEAPVHDPTQFQLGDLLADVRDRPLEPPLP
jgi:hypothetical protein